MKKGLYILAALFFAACSPTEEETVDQTDVNSITEDRMPQTTESIRSTRDSISVQVNPEAPVQSAVFSGTWFQIDYPENFVPSPTFPTGTYGDYHFVSTDEARFTSPDSTVEFFIFSPQWAGDPVDYLIEQPNEKMVSSTEEKSDSDDPFAASHYWVTYEDKDGKYTRSYHSLKTESTHHVFGVKYTNRKMYEKYKAAYLTFKKSLRQFAD